MADHTELKRLAEAAEGVKFQTEGFEQTDGRGQHYGGLILHENGHTIIASCVMQPWADFIAAANPATVLALIAENEQSNSRLREVATACATAEQERDQLRAENAGLQTGYKAYEQVNAELRAEVEALKAKRNGKILCDRELFENLRDAASTEAEEHRQCMATYRPLRQQYLDSVVKKCDDLLAAMGQGEQS